MNLISCSYSDPVTFAGANAHPLTTYKLVDFPFFFIGDFNYKPLAAGALANMATWSVLQLKGEIDSFLAS